MTNRDCVFHYHSYFYNINAGDEIHAQFFAKGNGKGKGKGKGKVEAKGDGKGDGQDNPVAPPPKAAPPILVQGRVPMEHGPWSMDLPATPKAAPPILAEGPAPALMSSDDESSESPAAEPAAEPAGRQLTPEEITAASATNPRNIVHHMTREEMRAYLDRLSRLS